MFPRLRFHLAILMGLCVVVGCLESGQPSSKKNAIVNSVPRIVVTSEPLLQMTQAIMGDAADVVLVVPEGISSPDWSPTVDDVNIMQQARLIFFSGAGYEPWKDRVSLPGSRTRDTATGYYDQFIRIPDAVKHQHGPDGAHSHPGTVWATWLDPALCAAQLHQVSVDGRRLFPGRKQAIDAAEASLSAELNSLNALIETINSAANNEALTLFSDAPHYQYLTRRLGWTLNYLHWDLADTISDANRTELLDAFKADPSNVLTPQNSRIFLLDLRHSTATEDFVRQSGGIVVRIDLCENASPKVHSLPNRLKQNLARIRDAIEEYKCR